MDDRVMRKNIMKRNIRYWGWRTEKTTATLLIVAFIYGIIFFSGKTGSLLLSGFISYLMMAGIIFMAIEQVNRTSRYLPMALSFGAGRRETAWGMQFANMLMFVQILLVVLAGSWAMKYVSGSDAEYLQRIMGLLHLAFANILLLSAAVGQFWAIAKIRCQKGIAIFTTFFIGMMVVVCCAGGILMFPFVNSGTWIPEENVIAVIRPASVAAGILGGICYLIGAVLMKRAVLQYEVRG